MAFQGNIFRPQLQTGTTMGPAAELTSSAGRLLGDLYNQREARKQDLITGIMGEASDLFQNQRNLMGNEEIARLQEQGKNARLALELPQTMQSRAAQLMTVAAGLEQAGDFEGARATRQQAQQYLIHGQGIAAGNGGAVPLIGTPMPIEDMTPLAPAGETTSTPSDMGVDLNTGTLGEQRIKSEFAQKKTEGQKSLVNFESVSSLRNNGNLEEGSELRARSGHALKGIRAGIFAKELLEEGEQLAANAPDKYVAQRQDLDPLVETFQKLFIGTKSSKGWIEIIEESKLLDEPGFLKLAITTPFPVVNTAIGEAGAAITGASSSKKRKDMAAIDANNKMKSLLPKTARDSGQVGNLSDTDIGLVEGLVAALGKGRAEFQTTKQEIVEYTLPNAINAAVRLGDFKAANKLQEIYKKQTGGYYEGDKGGSSAASSVNPPNAASPTTKEANLPQGEEDEFQFLRQILQ